MVLSFEGSAPKGNQSWSPDGNRLVTASQDKTKVLDARTGKGLLFFKRKNDRSGSLGWSPDGSRVVSHAQGGWVDVWDSRTGKEVLSLENPNIRFLAWSRDGRRVAIGWEFIVKVHDAHDGRELLSLKGHRKWVSCAAWSRDGKRILTGSRDHTAKIWDAISGKELLSLEGHTDDVYAVSWSPDGKRILTGDGGKSAKVWDAGTGHELLSLVGHTDSVASVSWGPDGRRVLTGSHDKTAKVWDAHKCQAVFSLGDHTSNVTRIAFSPDGKCLFAWDDQQKLLAWSAVTGHPVEPTDPPPMPAAGTARSPDGFLEARAVDNKVEITDKRLVDPKANHWPLPDISERKAYHAEQAALAEKAKQHFALAFHLGRLLLDDPGNAGLKKRRDAALKAHAESSGK